VTRLKKKIAAELIGRLNIATGWSLEILETIPAKNYVQFKIDENFGDEAYKLEVNKQNIVIIANGKSGFIYGLETIRQLLPEAIESSKLVSNVEWIIPNLEINDYPRFKWRGLMLDVSRHFFDKNYVKEVIDGLALHKMNVLHLHLVDDQGWRIEIKKYPKLTSIGGFRVDQEDASWSARVLNKPTDKANFGGFYTQEDIKEIVSYAASKGIQVVPEIEMPAHVMSAIAAYPELSCFENPIGVPSGSVWPITDIYCAGKDSTFEFLEDVLLEVIELFPSEYIHIGGDEATKTNWKICSHCQERMRSEGLHDVEELQSYFVKRMEKFINSHDKKLIGWDEILEGGLAPEATVMSWRGVKGGLEAASQGHDVVMTPGTHCYFDHYQGPQNEEPLAWGGYLPLSKVYKFDPIVESMSDEEAKHVLGGQANLWSEYIPTNEQSEYMIYPRIAALSETVWSTKASRDWDDFSRRITHMFNRYEYQGINYAKSAYLVIADTQMNLENKSVEVLLKNEFTDSDIRYVLNDDDLSLSAKKYTGPIQLKKTTLIKASLFKNDEPIGKELNEIIKFHKAIGKKVSFKEIYHDSYQGAGEFGMVNSLRGTKNFHDGQWQGWLGKDLEAIIDLGKEESIHQVTIGSMENQGSGIYFPIKIAVFVSVDGENFQEVGSIKRDYAKNAESELKDFMVGFEEVNARFVKVIVTNLKRTPIGGDVWLFVDEILID
jgi:hexosaminidase